jgi:hypothetical protein
MGEKSDRERLMQYLHTHKGRLMSAYRVERRAVIGSFARDDYRADSDIDLLVSFEPDAENIYDRKRSLAAELEHEFGRPVQIASEKYIKPHFRSHVLSQAVYV